jgi:hypothetical protein
MYLNNFTHKLFLKPEKCEFNQLETEYLRMIVSEGKVTMDPIKVEGIKSWMTPTCKQDVQSFLGFYNFYHRFIKDYADVARPLNYLTGNSPFVWTSECNDAFNQLKIIINTALVLAIPNNERQFHVEADASAYALGAILS